MDEFHEVSENQDCSSPIEELRTQIQTQTVTIRTLKVLLDQYKNEIDSLGRSKPLTCANENRAPSNLPIKIEPQGIELKLALQVDKLEAERVRLESSNQSLRTKLRMGCHSHDALATKLQEIEQESHNLTVRLSVCEKEKSKLGSKIGSLNDHVRTLNSQLSDSIQRTEHESVVSEIVERLLQKDVAIDVLRQENRTALSELEQQVARSKVLQEIHERLVTDCSTTQKRIEMITTENKELLSHNNHLETIIHDATATAARESTRTHEDNMNAISILNETHEKRMNELLSRLELSTKMINLKEAQMRQLGYRIVNLESQLATVELSNIQIDVGTQMKIQTGIGVSQTDSVHRNMGIQTAEPFVGKRQLLASLKSLSSCSRCQDQAVSTLFPCGHGLCSACVENLMSNDTALLGITCDECANNLPISRVSLNYPLISMGKYIASIASTCESLAE